MPRARRRSRIGKRGMMSDKRLKLLFITIFFCALLVGPDIILAQAPVTAEVDRTNIGVNEQLTLSVTVSGELLDIPTPDLSRLQDFRVVGSSSSTQISIINGELTTQGRFLYRLQPLGEGALVIPPIAVEVDGQSFQTEPIHIEVIAGNVPPPTGEDTAVPDSLNGGVLVEAEVDNPTPYLGQQIIYTFRFFYQPNSFFRQPDFEPPAFTNFWGQNILAQPQFRAVIDGQEYIVTEMRTALFPASIGQLTIDPTEVSIPGGLLEPDIIRETEQITVDVRPLPDGSPPDFRGAVGQFDIRASLSETTGKVNEPVTLSVELEGSGNIEMLTEPNLPELPNWRIFESQVSTQIDIQNDKVHGTRRFERLIVPGQHGEYTIPPIHFSYFDPEAIEYRIVSTEPMLIAVEPGEVEESTVTVIGADKQPVAILAGDIRHIKPVPTALYSVDVSMLTNSLYWACWLGPALVVGSVWLWQRRRQRFAADEAYARRKTARRTARKRLAEAKRSETGSYVLVQRALLGYLSDKLNSPTVGLTADSLTGLLREAQLEPALIERVQAILNQTDIGRFAPVEKGTAEALISDTRRLINDIEKAFRRG